MASFLDRLIGRTETLPSVIEQPIEAKAVTGPGAFSMMYGTPIHSFSRDPHRLMAEAQALFHTNAVVATAERKLGGLFVRMDWHLEDENGDTVDEKSPEPYQQPLRLLQRPAAKKYRHSLWGLTFRHQGLPGNGFWFLDQRDRLADTPLELVYINPARMTPAQDRAGNVVGWVLDHPENQVLNRMGADYQRTGVPLSVDEVIHFTMDEPDWGVWGVGWVESAQRKIELDRLSNAHGAGVLASGGRLSGLITPKVGATVTDDQWVQFVRDWRSITSDPDAAKRLQIAKMPLDFEQMTANLRELQYTEINKATRDDIFAYAGVPVSQVGINVPDDGDRAEADKEIVWETVKQRAEPFREKVQFELLDRWQALGVKVTLVFDYPEFADQTPQYESLAKSINGPLTNDERRNILGLEPLEDEELGKAIYIHQSLVRIDEEPEPEIPAPPVLLPSTATDEETEVVEGKADLRKPLLGLRAKTETEWEPKVRAVVQRVLKQQEVFVVSKLDHAVRKNDLSWWSDKREDRRFSEALEPTILAMARDVANRTTATVSKPTAKADTWLERVIQAIRTSVGERITGINQTTRDKIQSAIEHGVEAGESPADIGLRIRESAAFDEGRSELISRTETMNVYNDAALRSYGELEVTEVEAIDGDQDAECAARNGKRYPINEAMGISDHPQGTLDWVPVI